MIRTTISKIRKVCSVSFIPRALRVGRSGTGKFEKFSFAAVKSILVRPKSGTRNDDQQPKTIEFHFTSKATRPQRDQFTLHEDQAGGVPHKKTHSDQVQIKPETECEKCERLIAAMFGVDSGRTPIGEVEDGISLDQARLQAKSKDGEIDAGAPNQIRTGQTSATDVAHMPAKALENIAQVSLASNKTTEYSDEDLKAAKVHASKVYDDPAKIDKDIVTLQATTEKQDKELSQKVEKIVETPVVDAKEPEIEGFNVTPQTLDDKAVVNFGIQKNSQSDSTSQRTVPENIEEIKLDEIASRCINTPDKEIDEQILNEMNTLKSSSPDDAYDNEMREAVKALDKMIEQERNSMEMDEWEQEYKKSTHRNILQRLYPTYDNHLFENENDINTQQLKTERFFNENKPLYEIETHDPIESTQSDVMQEELSYDRPIIHPNQVIIDPYDKKTLSYEKADDQSIPAQTAFENMYAKQEHLKKEVVTQQLIEPGENDVTKDEPSREVLDPRYVVTCNETCPISADGLTITAINTESSPLKGAKAIYDDLDGTAFKKQASNSMHDPLEKDKNPDLKNNEEVISEEKPQIETTEPSDNVEEQKCNKTTLNAVSAKLGDSEIEATHKADPAEKLSTTCLQPEIAVRTLVKPDLHEEKPVDMMETQPAGMLEVEPVSMLEKESAGTLEDKSAGTLEKEPAGTPEKEPAGTPEKEPTSMLEKAPLGALEKEPPAMLEKEPVAMLEKEAGTLENKPPATLEKETAAILEKTPADTLKKDPAEPLEKDLGASAPIQSNCMPLPKLNEGKASLSELLRRVRQRNRLTYCKEVDLGATAVEQLSSQAAVVDPAIGKCGKKPPPCPPPAPTCPPAPKCPEKPAKTACPPPSKRTCPPPNPPCPPKKDPCAKYTGCPEFTIPNVTSSSLQTQLFPHLTLSTLHVNRGIREGVVLNRKAVLTDDIIDRIQNLGRILCRAFQRTSFGGKCSFRKTLLRERFSSKSFEPWTPIPSWPYPKKEVRKPFVCPKEGCKMLPPPKANAPCPLHPCLNFPKRSFSMSTLLAQVKDESKVYNYHEM